MTHKNTKASNSTLSDIQYKLSDFIPEFSKFRHFEPEINYKYGDIDNNLYKSYKKGKIYFKSINIRCHRCKSRHVNLNVTIQRKLIFLNEGEQICLVQQFQCKTCGTTISTDLSSIVKANSNITHQVIEHIIHLYSFFSGTLHKIQKSLKEEHKIEISHQSIENIILFSNYELNIENWTLSGYYIFDALWVKKDGNWWYLICLFDVKINTIVLRSLVKSESSDIIRDFIAKSLRNQKKKCITTDLKHEYHIALNQLKINQQFCLFHSKQKINRDIKEHVDENKLNEEKIDEIIFYKKLIFEIFDAESFLTFSCPSA